MKSYPLINFQARILKALPSNLRELVNSIRVLPKYIYWYMHPSGREHLLEVLKPYRDHFFGYRCVVIGNGPSLNDMDLSLLENEYTFGLNRIYLLFEEMGFKTTFLVSVNRFVLNQFSADICKLPILKFISWSHRSQYSADNNTVFVSFKPSHKAKGKINDGVYPLGATVTNVALEIAYYMGFSEVILIGVDHSYEDKGMGNIAVVSQKDDNNHFSKGYFGPGITWQLPDYKLMEKGYQVMKELFKKNDRQIVDATLNGKLQIFPKVSFEEYLSSSKYLNRMNE